MKLKLTMAALAAVIAAPTIAPETALARHRHVYHGHTRVYRTNCGGGDGAVGTIVGAGGGALIGNAVGGGTVGTITGGVGGALLGRHLDKQNTRSRRGC